MTLEEIKNNDFDKIFRTNALVVKEAKGLNQADLARATGLTYNRICQWERGNKQLRLCDACLIANALGVDMNRLLNPKLIKVKMVTTYIFDEES